MGAGISCVRVGDNGPFLALGDITLLSRAGVDAVVADPTIINDEPEYYINWGDLSGGVFIGQYPNAAVSAGTLLRDLKRSVTAYGSNGLKLHIFRQVQLISGPATEGVSGSPSDIDAYKCGWTCIWSANGATCGPIILP